MCVCVWVCVCVCVCVCVFVESTKIGGAFNEKPTGSQALYFWGRGTDSYFETYRYTGPSGVHDNSSSRKRLEPIEREAWCNRIRQRPASRPPSFKRMCVCVFGCVCVFVCVCYFEGILFILVSMQTTVFGHSHLPSRAW